MEVNGALVGSDECGVVTKGVLVRVDAVNVLMFALAVCILSLLHLCSLASPPVDVWPVVSLPSQLLRRPCAGARNFGT